MLTPREAHTATLPKDGTVLVTGGVDTGGTVLATAELYQ
jgi:KaiC/GvpD/RAD55 family RecA-like ATPase